MGNVGNSPSLHRIEKYTSLKGGDIEAVGGEEDEGQGQTAVTSLGNELSNLDGVVVVQRYEICRQCCVCLRKVIFRVSWCENIEV